MNSPQEKSKEKEEKGPKITPYNLSEAYYLRQSFFVLLLRLIGLELLFLVLTLILWGFMELFQVERSLFSTWLFWSLQSMNLSLALTCIVLWYNHYYILSPSEILKGQGFLIRHTFTYDIGIIKSINVRQSIVQRLLGYGTLEIKYAVTPMNVETLFISNIQRPYEHAKIIDFQRLNPPG